MNCKEKMIYAKAEIAKGTCFALSKNTLMGNDVEKIIPVMKNQCEVRARKYTQS